MITQVALEPLETQYLFQRIFIARQRGNKISFRNTFKNESAKQEDDQRGEIMSKYSEEATTGERSSMQTRG